MSNSCNIYILIFSSIFNYCSWTSFLLLKGSNLRQNFKVNEHKRMTGRLGWDPVNKHLCTRQKHVFLHVIMLHNVRAHPLLQFFVGPVPAPLLHHRLAGPLALGGAGARPLPCKLRVASTTSGPKTGSYSYFEGWHLHFIACVIPQGASSTYLNTKIST